MADDKSPETAKDIEGAQPEQVPPNVVTDNTGQVPVQPVGTSDPTIDDNTNPKVPFDGSDPRNIPPHDSNEQLHIAAAKRIGAEVGGLTTSADLRREAVAAAYDNSKDVRDVLGANDDSSADRVPDADGRREAGAAAVARSQANAGSRAQPPQGRTGRSGSTSKA